MPLVVLPFDVNKSDCSGKDQSCNLTNLLSDEAQDAIKKNVHLSRYIHMLPIKVHGTPQYHLKLERKMSSNKTPNLIYPVKNGIFTHILHDPNDGRNTYIPIEPTIGQNMDSLMNEIEKRLLVMADVLSINMFGSDEEKKALILQCLEKVCTTTPQGTSNRIPNGNGGAEKRSFASSLLDKTPFFKNSMDTKMKPLVVTPAQLRAIKYLIVRDKIGLGVLDPLVTDTYVEDISCSGMGPIYLEHKIFKSLKTVIDFPTNDDLDSFVMRLAERIKKPVSVHSPIVDATLPDGSRINIVYFLPPMSRFLPLRVLALVLERCPRTGKPRRCLYPR